MQTSILSIPVMRRIWCVPLANAVDALEPCHIGNMTTI